MVESPDAIAPVPALFLEADSNQASTLVIGLNQTILVGLAAVDGCASA
jgi:hypothetical protein